MEGIIEVNGEIGERVTLDTVKAQIKPGATSYTVYINSIGGDVYEGIAIYNTIKNLPNVTVVVEGIAASIATLIMQAGKKIIAYRSAFIIIHNPFAQIQGESKDFRATAAQLDRIKSTIISTYKQRMKKSEVEIAKMMDDETQMTADQAVAAGLVDEAVDHMKAVARVDLKKFEIMDNNEVKGALESFGAKIDKMFDSIMAKFPKVKNLIVETLEGGEEIQIAAEEGEDWTGKPATIGGQPAPAGPHKLASGEIVNVGEGGVVASVGTAPQEDEAMKAENEKLKKDVSAAQESQKVAQEALAAANKSLAEMKGVMTSMQKEFKEFKNKIENTTAGDTNPPKVAVRKEPKTDRVENDPMSSLWESFTSSRN